jgi:uncharacterized membrane protein
MAGRKQARAASGQASATRTAGGTKAGRGDAGQAQRGAAAAQRGSQGRTAGQGRTTGQGRSGQSRQGDGRPGKAPANGRAGQAASSGNGTTSPDKAKETGAAAAPRWLQLTTLILSLAGFGLGIYVTIVHYQPTALVCSSNSLVDCAAVLTSPESVIFGIPVAEFGLAFFVFMIAINTPWAWRSGRREIHLARLGGAVVGMVFVLYLIYVELIEVGKICLWCTSVHVVTFLLFTLIVFNASMRGVPGTPAAPGETARART